MKNIVLNLAFSTNESMILQAADELKPVLFDEILGYKSLVQV